MCSLTHACRVAVIVAIAALPLRAQHAGGRVAATGRVSGVAAVSAGSAGQVMKGDAQVSAGSNGAHGLVLSLSGARGGETQLELPVQLRSNVRFGLIASCATGGTRLSSLSVVEVGGAGQFVHPGAAERVQVSPAFDGRVGTPPASSGGPDLSSPATILTGPPVSTGGTLDAPNNMIEVVLRVVLAAPAGAEGWHAELRLSAEPSAGEGRPARPGPQAR